MDRIAEELKAEEVRVIRKRKEEMGRIKRRKERSREVGRESLA